MAELLIDDLGRQGDGIARENGTAIYVPFALAGEKVSVTGKGSRRELIDILEKSPDRVEPVCRHFGICGGCQVQHLSASSYRDWKQEAVSLPLRKAGIDHPIEPLAVFKSALRRKVVFGAKNTNEGILIGFAERSSDRIIPVDHCPVTDAGIVGSIPNLKNLVASLPQSRKPFRLAVMATENGLDVNIEGVTALKASVRDVLIRKALAYDFARLSWEGEVLIENRKPGLSIGVCTIVPPPGSFVQALLEAEHLMADLVSSHLSDCKATADLFSGMGTFALRLAATSTVWAIEENAAALSSLDRAWRDTGGKLKQVKTETRNLDRRPASFQELKKIDGLVFDPPRAGAEIQARQIAKSRVKKVAAVSCNPTTLARDLDILIKGGYRVTRIVPIDQFVYTPHVEVVVLLER